MWQATDRQTHRQWWPLYTLPQLCLTRNVKIWQCFKFLTQAIITSVITNSNNKRLLYNRFLAHPIVYHSTESVASTCLKDRQRLASDHYLSHFGHSDQHLPWHPIRHDTQSSYNTQCNRCDTHSSGNTQHPNRREIQVAITFNVLTDATHSSDKTSTS